MTTLSVINLSGSSDPLILLLVICTAIIWKFWTHNNTKRSAMSHFRYYIGFYSAIIVCIVIMTVVVVVVIVISFYPSIGCLLSVVFTNVFEFRFLSVWTTYTNSVVIFFLLPSKLSSASKMLSFHPKYGIIIL